MFGKWRLTAREKAEYNDEPMICYDYEGYDYTGLVLHRAEWHSILKVLSASYSKEVREIAERFAEQLEGNVIQTSSVTFGNDGLTEEWDLGNFGVTDVWGLADYVIY